MEKVCVRIPADKKEELLAIAAKWRAAAGDKGPGWDAKAIHRIAKDHFNGLEGLFIAYDWPERGSQMTQKVQMRVKEKFGTVENFVSRYE